MKDVTTRVYRSSDTSCGIPHVRRLGFSTLATTVFPMSLAVMVYALNKVSLKATQRAYVKLNAQQTRNLGGDESEGGFWRLVSSLWLCCAIKCGIGYSYRGTLLTCASRWHSGRPFENSLNLSRFTCLCTYSCIHSVTRSLVRSARVC